MNVETSEERRLYTKSSQGKTETAERMWEHGADKPEDIQGGLWTITIWGPVADPTLIRSLREQMALG